MRGRYFRIGWSTCWRDVNPWSLDGRDMPYVGWRNSTKNGVAMISLGPIALIAVNIGVD